MLPLCDDAHPAESAESESCQVGLYVGAEIGCKHVCDMASTSLAEIQTPQGQRRDWKEDVDMLEVTSRVLAEHTGMKLVDQILKLAKGIAAAQLMAQQQETLLKSAGQCQTDITDHSLEEVHKALKVVGPNFPRVTDSSASERKNCSN